MKTLNIRESLLETFFIDIRDFENFKCIITSRPSYISSMDFQNVINILPFDSEQVGEFYFKVKNEKINHRKINWDNLEILGIPVILYMAIMSNINIDKRFTKPELYSRIFAIRGGIFDRFYDGETEYGTGGQILRKPKNIKKYLTFLQDTAFKMFEKDDLQLKKEECRVPDLEFEKKKISVLEFPIKHLFENTEDNIEFIHKSIYEFFVSEYIFESIYNVLNDSDDKFACCLGRCLEGGVLSEEIIEFIEFRFKNSKKMVNQFERFVHIFEIMMKEGMTFYVKRRLKKVINRETLVFTNMLHILHLWEFDTLHMNCDLVRYYLQDKKIMYDLSRLSLMRANLKGINLAGQNLKMTNLRKTDLRGADLRGTDLCGANLCGADLRRADLRGARLEGSIWYESDIRKSLSQIESTHFKYLMIRENNKTREILRKELFPNE